MAIYVNNTTGVAFDLIVKGSQQGGNIKKRVVTNKSGHTAVVSICLDDGSNTYYFAYKIDVPTKTGFILEDVLSFDKDTYGLKAVNIGTNPDIDVIIE